MKKLRIEDLEKISQKVKKNIMAREGGQYRVRVIVHMGTCGIAAGGRKIMSAFVDEVEKRNLSDVFVMASGCAGLCSREPMATVEVANQPPVKYVDLTPEKVATIFEEHVMGGNIVKDSALVIGSERTG